MMSPPTLWPLVAGLAAAAVTILVSRFNTLPPDMPPAVVFLGTWAVLLVLQAAWWVLRRRNRA